MRPGQKVPRKIKQTHGLRARAWWVLRKNKVMTSIEIQSTVCNGSEKSADSNLRRWLIKLVDAGILSIAKIDDGKLTSNGSNLYSLVLDLGPVAPIVRARTGQVFDPNSNSIVEINKADKKVSPTTYKEVADAVTGSL